MKAFHYALLIFSVFSLSACSSLDKNPEYSAPLLSAWYNGKMVHYITTDVSDRDMAREMGANYAPRLRDAIPDYPKPPRQKTVIERVYGFPDGEQPNNVFGSAPSPVGYHSTDEQYSPVWHMYWVRWTVPGDASVLTSEEAILDAEERGLITLERTDIVVNCPIVSSPHKIEGTPNTAFLFWSFS